MLCQAVQQQCLVQGVMWVLACWNGSYKQAMRRQGSCVRSVKSALALTAI